MNRKVSLLAMIFFPLFLLDCKKEIAHYTISEDFKQWVFFKKGSYWIYKNENSAVIDSCYIPVTPLFATSNSEEESGYLYDFIETHFISSFLESSYIRSAVDYCFADFHTYNTISVGSIRTNINVGQKVTWGNGVFEELAIYNTYTLNDSVFQNVIHTKITFSGNGYNDSLICQYFFSKNIGLIKFEKSERNTDSIWSILRWHVIQ